MNDNLIEIDLRPAAMLEAQRQATIQRLPIRKFLSDAVNSLFSEAERSTQSPPTTAKEDVV